MKKMKKINKLFALLALSLVSVSCLVDDEAQNGFEASPYSVGFDSKETLESYFVDIGPVGIDIAVNVLGGNSGIALPTDVSVSYTVDPSSTAVAGNEFNLTGSSFTIAAGTSFGILPIEINTGGLDPDQPTELILKLTSTDNSGTIVSGINDTYKITFVGCQSDHAGTYTNPDVPSGALGMATITQLAPNTFRISAMPFLGFGGTSPITIDFQNVCGEIKWTQWEVGTFIEGPGSFDEVTGAISFEYLKIYNGSDISSGIWFDLDGTTYTPL